MGHSYSVNQIDDASNVIAGLIATGDALAVQKPDDFNRDAYKRAIATYISALNATTIYLVKTKTNPQKRDLEEERNLSELWSAAAIDISTFSPDLANRCFIKSQGWLDPEIWRDDRFKGYPVQLADMRESLLALNIEHRTERSVPRADTVTHMNADDKTLVTRTLNSLQNHPYIAAITIFATVVGALGSFTVSLTKIISFAKCLPFICALAAPSVTAFFDGLTYSYYKTKNETMPHDVILNITNDENRTITFHKSLKCIAKRKSSAASGSFILTRLYESLNPDVFKEHPIGGSYFVLPPRSNQKIRFNDSTFQGPDDFFSEIALYDLDCELEYLDQRKLYSLQIHQEAVTFIWNRCEEGRVVC